VTIYSRDKQFLDGESVLILMPDDTSSCVGPNCMWSRWKAPAKIINKASGYSYLAEYDEVRHVTHTNKLRRHNVRANSVHCHAASYDDGYKWYDVNVRTVIREQHDEFGHVPIVNASMDNLKELLPTSKIDTHGLSRYQRRNAENY
jgi:hypothetical protein